MLILIFIERQTITEKDNLIEDLENKLMVLDMNEKLTDRVLWDSIKNKNTNLYTNKSNIYYLNLELASNAIGLT